MKHNIIIAGVPRAGKTTLSHMLSPYGYQHISMDAIIAGFECCFPETGINTYQGLSSMDTLCVISSKIAPFINGMLEIGAYDRFDCGMVIDVYQLLPNDLMKYINRDLCDAYWLGSADLTIEERFNLMKQYDTERDYTYHKTEAEIREGCKYITEQSRFIKEQCKRHNLQYRDTSFFRDQVLIDLLKEITGR